ncbi:hypothetical protein [Rubrivirga marina]|uniref:Uncharacterized protein n=1 Tax=Rubrivirga marina TaxID=1196024 RepID=A0A271J1X6_9BACT|nr:hypothetical protein [Rubrivirga marina]PAP77516.1 hypothetical protein BSZ37_14245 [Rubrivirga marina]
MDSPPSVSQASAAPVPADGPPSSGALAEAPPGALARLGRLLPGVDAIVRFAYRLAGVSGIAALLIVAAVLRWVPQLAAGVLVALGLLLLVPAAAVAIAGWTLADLASLPRQVREAALATTGREASREAVKGSRVVRLLKSLWAARGLALLTKGGWVKAVGALRFLRLASLPFALALLSAVALNGVVIVGGLVAVVLLILG